LEQLDSSGDRTERICFYFGDFVLEDPGVTPVEKMDIFKILERMLERGIHVVACVSPLASGEIFSPYSENVLELLRELGCEEIETFRPSDFLDGVQAFMESI